MKYNHEYKENKSKNLKKARSIILFIVITAFIVGGSALMVMKFSKSKQAVQAVQAEVDKEKDLESSDKDNNTDSSNNIPSVESDSSVEDVAFIEKYLDQQMKGQKPDGADGKKVVY